MERTEWMEVNDIISEDLSKGKIYQVTKIDLEKKGIVVKDTNPQIESYSFISDADATKYYRIQNINDKRITY